MSAQWLLGPVALCVLSALGLALCLSCCLALRGKIRVLDRSRNADRQAFAAAIAEVRSALEGMESRWREIEEQVSTLTPAPPKSGFNLTKRSQALRMHRRGEMPDLIATALGLPRGEVDLLLKVHRIVAEHGGASAECPAPAAER